MDVNKLGEQLDNAPRYGQNAAWLLLKAVQDEETSAGSASRTDSAVYLNASALVRPSCLAKMSASGALAPRLRSRDSARKLSLQEVATLMQEYAEERALEKMLRGRQAS
jgi:hypothetical protein